MSVGYHRWRCRYQGWLGVFFPSSFASGVSGASPWDVERFAGDGRDRRSGGTSFDTERFVGAQWNILRKRSKLRRIDFESFFAMSAARDG